MKSFNAIMDVLDRFATDDEAAETIRKLSEAALADEDGVALKAALDEVG